MNIRFFNHQVEPRMLETLGCSLNALDDRLESVFIYACEKATPISDKPIQEIHLKAILVNGMEISLIESQGDKQEATVNIARRLRQLLAIRYPRTFSSLDINAMANIQTINHQEKTQ